jgi:hypothetical protein
VEGPLSLEEKRTILDWTIRPQLRTLPGVADVNSLGGHAKAFEVVPDAGTFARALGRALVQRYADKPAPPGHVELLNLLARAAGHRSYQGLRAAARMPDAAAALETVPAAPALTPAARKALTQFDALGRLVRWPHKFSVQRLAMWVLWTQFDGRRIYTEREVNEVIKRWNTWGDHVTLRRELINHQLLARKSDCSQYWKLPARPDDEVRWLLRAWRERVRQAA